MIHAREGDTMRFFHISDLHIGKQLYQYNLFEDQKYILEQIVQLLETEKPDALLIAGDIYDRPIPSAEAVSIFDWFLTEVSLLEPKIPVLIISGNHDSAQRLDYARSILSRQNIYVVGTAPEKPDEFIQNIVLEDQWGPVRFYMLPFVKPVRLRSLFTEEENMNYSNLAKETGRNEYDVYFEKLIARENINREERNILLTHQFFTAMGTQIERTESEIVTVGNLDNIDVSCLEPFDYVAMGHIHRAQKCGKTCYRYCGTPMAYSVSEEKDCKAVTLVTIEEKNQILKIDSLPLTPMRKVQKLMGTKEEILRNGKLDDYVSLILTDDHTDRFLREELNEYFSHILDIRFDNAFTRKLTKDFDATALSSDFYGMFCSFFQMRCGREMSKEEETLLIKTLQEVKEEEE